MMMCRLTRMVGRQFSEILCQSSLIRPMSHDPICPFHLSESGASYRHDHDDSSFSFSAPSTSTKASPSSTESNVNDSERKRQQEAIYDGAAPSTCYLSDRVFGRNKELSYLHNTTLDMLPLATLTLTRDPVGNMPSSFCVDKPLSLLVYDDTEKNIFAVNK
jgi:hypothetical protein